MKIKDTSGFQGISFGLMDSVITVLGIILGLSVTEDKLVMIIGILSIGLADSIANAAGIHVAKETAREPNRLEVWKATVYCFLATFIVVTIMAVPFFFFDIKEAVIMAWVIGTIILAIIGYFVSLVNKQHSAIHLVVEYVLLGAIVSVLAYGIGYIIKALLTSV